MRTLTQLGDASQQGRGASGGNGQALGSGEGDTSGVGGLGDAFESRTGNLGRIVFDGSRSLGQAARNVTNGSRVRRSGIELVGEQNVRGMGGPVGGVGGVARSLQA